MADSQRDIGPISRSSLRRLLAIFPLTIVATEMIVTLLLPELAQAGVLTNALVDTAALMAVLAPLLWWFVYRPFSRHIQEREQVLRSLQESEWRFRDIVEGAHEWVWEVDNTGRYTYSSPVAGGRFGSRISWPGSGGTSSWCCSPAQQRKRWSRWCCATCTRAWAPTTRRLTGSTSSL